MSRTKTAARRDPVSEHLDALERRYREQFTALDDLIVALRRSDQALRAQLIQMRRPS